MKRKLALILSLITVLATVFSITAFPVQAAATPARVDPDQLEVGTSLPTSTKTNLEADENADFGDFYSTYNHASSRATVTVEEENGENYLAMRAGDNVDGNYIYTTSVLTDTIPAGTTVKVKLVFRPTKDFVSTANSEASKFIIRLGSTKNDLRMGDFFSANEFDGETWLAYEKEITLKANCKYFHFYNYAAAGHGCDIKSIELTEVTAENVPASVDPNQIEAGTALPTKTTRNLVADANAYFGDFYSTYNNTSSRAVMTVEEENGENYVAMRASDNVGSNYILNTSVLTSKIPNGSILKVKIVFRPTKDYSANTSKAGSKFILRLDSTKNDMKFGSAFSAEQFDGETWLTYEYEITLRADCKYVHFYNYAQPGHGCDVKSIEITYLGGGLPEIATKAYDYDTASNQDLAVTVDTKGSVVESLFVKGPEDADMHFVARNAYSMSEDLKTLTIEGRWLKDLDIGENTFTVQIEENYYTFTVTATAPAVIVGDASGDGAVTKDDAIYILMYTFFETQYPANQDFDFNKDGTVTKDDAIYVLMYTFFPDTYPLG